MVEKDQKEILDFLNRAEKQRAYCVWVFLSFGKVYLRKTQRYIEKRMVSCLVVATIEIEQEFREKGYFSRFMDFLIEINPYEMLFLESVLSEKIISWCRKRQWKQNGDDICPEFYQKNKNFKERKEK